MRLPMQNFTVLVLLILSINTQEINTQDISQVYITKRNLFFPKWLKYPPLILLKIIFWKKIQSISIREGHPQKRKNQ